MKKTLLAIALGSAMITAPFSLMAFASTESIRVEQATQAMENQDTQKLAQLAYEYAYSIDEAYKYFYRTAIENDYPLNRFENIRKLADDTYTAHPSINNDTLHVMGWMDLAAEPVIVSIPQMDEGRYWLLHTMNLEHFTDSAIGSADYGSKGGVFMYAVEGWEGDVPDSVDEVIYVEHPISKLMGRIMDLGGDDSVLARDDMDGWNLRTLSEYLGKKGVDPVVRNYPDPANTNWVERVNFVLSEGTLAKNDKDLLAEFGLVKLGDPVGTTFTTDELKIIDQAEKDGYKHISTSAFQDSRDVVGTRAQMAAVPSYQHAFGTFIGQWGLPPEQTMYQGIYADKDGQPLDGHKYDYTVTFDAPVVEKGGFWSYTVYNGETRLMEHNSMNRHSRGDRSMIANADGTYTLTMSSDVEGNENNPNFLPIPDGSWYGLLRMYTPSADVINDVWKSTPFSKVEK